MLNQNVCLIKLYDKSKIYFIWEQKMNLIQKGHKNNSHRALIGLESAIIIIAFVIVVAALAFVVINMGLSTSQTAKTAIRSTMTSASSSLEPEGKVIASSYRPPVGEPSLNVTSIPIRIAAGGESVNLDPSVTAVKYLSNQITYDNIYSGTLMASGIFSSLKTATAQALVLGYIDRDPFTGAGPGNDDWPSETAAFIYWTVASNTNNILEVGEHAVLAIVFASGDRPEYVDKIRIELILPDGATLTVERIIPPITNELVDLG